MKTRLFLLACAAVLLTQLSSCKKDDKKKDELDAEVQQFNSDAGSYKAELDQADNDINTSVSNTSMGFGAGSGGSSPLCGVTIDTSQIGQKIIIFNFDGITPCFSPSRTRSGQIKVQLTSGARWGDVGSVLTETFINYKVTRLSDNKSIMFNGVKTYTNVNGNNWVGFFTSNATLKYRERALNISVKFDNNQTATWNSARVTEWKYTAANVNPAIPYSYITFTAKGDTALNSYANVDSWGTNRYGSNFTTYYNTPIVSNTYCGLWRFNAGELVHHVNNSDFTFTLGVDQNGNPTPYTCAYGFKVTWASNGTIASAVLSY